MAAARALAVLASPACLAAMMALSSADEAAAAACAPHITVSTLLRQRKSRPFSEHQWLVQDAVDSPLSVSQCGGEAVHALDIAKEEMTELKSCSLCRVLYCPP